MIAKLLIWILYRVRVHGQEHVPRDGGAVIVSNHMTYLDVVFLVIAARRRIRFIASDTLHRTNRLRWLVKLSGIELIPPAKTRSFFERNIEHLKQGGLLGIFAEGQVSRTGNLMALQRGFDAIARESHVPVIPVFMDNLWQTNFSFFNPKGMHLKHKPFRMVINIAFGHRIPHDKVSMSGVRTALLDLSEYCFQRRTELQGHIADFCFRGLARHPFFEQLIDYTTERKSLKSGILLALALLTAKHIRNRVTGERVGIVLPPGIAGTVANLGVLFAGKIPVNMNFTAGKSSVKASLRKGEIDTVITAAPLRKKLPQFPWPEDTMDIVPILQDFDKKAILLRYILIILCPSALLTRMLGIPRYGDDEEAGLLFTSGSSGEPKGVPLSHRNILSNVLQIDEVALLSKDDTTIMCCLPIFHSFGYTVTMWYPLIRGVKMVSVPSPLEQKKIADAIEAEKVTVFIGTRTFFKPYVKRVPSEKLASLDLIVAGAEKVTPEFFDVWKEKFGSEINEGYGLTETSPVVSVNLKNPQKSDEESIPQTAYRRGSVGRMVPGITARIKDPDTNEDHSLFEPGMLYLKGANIFSGYLDDPVRNAEILKDGWFKTGDLARFDEDGFLHIEGRQSRFSKIGGEMVPHETIEAKIVELLHLKEEEMVPLIVSSRPDDAKGEALVLLTCVDIDEDDLRQQLTDIGFPNLWIPRIVKRVPEIPILASGKIDLKGCQAIASE
ncbi:MAG: AMP-binding protein [Verrucomicrobiae bacterium]|nr:AMP-binding protein [Verrucomicrobiae bacterium]